MCAQPCPRPPLGSVSTCLQRPLVPLHLLRPLPSQSLSPPGPEPLQPLLSRSLLAPPLAVSGACPPVPRQWESVQGSGREGRRWRQSRGWGRRQLSRPYPVRGSGLTWRAPCRAVGSRRPTVIVFPLSRIDHFPGGVSAPLLRNYRSTGRKSTPRKTHDPFTQQKTRTQQGPGASGPGRPLLRRSPRVGASGLCQATHHTWEPCTLQVGRENLSLFSSFGRGRASWAGGASPGLRQLVRGLQASLIPVVTPRPTHTHSALLSSRGPHHCHHPRRPHSPWPILAQGRWPSRLLASGCTEPGFL